MPRIYLAVPENGEKCFADGTNEQKYLRRLVYETVEHLLFNNVFYITNPPGMGISKIIDTANRGRFDLIISLNTSESPGSSGCKLQGSDIYYSSDCKKGAMCARIIYNEIRSIYPYPELVTCNPSNEYRELIRSKATCIRINTAYRDSSGDTQWLSQNIREIGTALARGICEIFNIGFKGDSPYRYSEISIKGGYLNVRSKPDTNSPIIMRVTNGRKVLIINDNGLWCKINIDGTDGFVNSQYIVSVHQA
ncbi:MAG: SH3 domain-containing protein [Clostridiales bacterium]|nr:SH3 domain-containing protein [Clostridiales bacterium]